MMGAATEKARLPRFAKKAVVTNKALAMNKLYDELETPEGERKIFRIAKARDKASKDFSHMKQIKNEHGMVLRDLDTITGRGKGYFNKLLNGENPGPSLMMECRMRD